jgi:hypothetical protein
VFPSIINNRKNFTLMNTAIDEKELPKLIPTRGGSEETSIGASAVPFGIDFGGAIAVDLD